LYDIVGFTDQ